MNRILAFMLVALLALSGTLLAQSNATTTVTSDSTLDSTHINVAPKGTKAKPKHKKRHKRVTTTTTTTQNKAGVTDTTGMNTNTGVPADTLSSTTVRRRVHRTNDTTGMLDSTGLQEGGRLRQDTINRPGTDVYAPGTGSGAPGRGTQTPAGTGLGSDTGTSTPSTGAGGTETYPRTGSSNVPPATSPDTTMMGTDTSGQTTSRRRTAEPNVGQETNQRMGRDVSGSGSTAGVPAPPTSGTAQGTYDKSRDTISYQGTGDTLRADSTYHSGQRIRGSATTDTDTIRGHDVTQGQPTNNADTMRSTGNRSYRGNETDWNTSVSGLEWRDIKIGDGNKANDGDKIQVRYTGWLQENNGRGRKFDSSIDRNKDFTFTLGAGQVIKGWDEGIVGMREGGIRELLIPASLGYGEAGAGGGVIPPNSTLIFQVELVKVNPTR